MGLRAEIEEVMETLARGIDGGHTSCIEPLHILEHLTRVPVEGWEDALSRKTEIERGIGRDITFYELDEMLLSYGLMDVKKIRRRYEDHLRKWASDEDIISMAQKCNIPRY